MQIIINMTCPECKSSEIKQTLLELYCTKCGYVITDSLQ